MLGGIKNGSGWAAVFFVFKDGLRLVFELAKGAFCGVEFARGEVVKADGRMVAVLRDGGVGEVDVASLIAAVATVDVGNLGGAPGFGDDAADAHGAFGGDGIDLPTHTDSFPERRKEHTDADGYEGHKEGAHADFEQDGDCTNGGFGTIDGDGVVGVAEDDGT